MHKTLCLLLLFISMNSKAQTNCIYRISGKVIDAQSKTTLPFARVELMPAGKIVVCNENGEFVFNELCAGDVELKSYYIGFDTLIQSISLRKNIEVKLRLMTTSKELKQTEVVAEHSEGKNTQLKDSVSQMDLVDAISQLRHDIGKQGPTLEHQEPSMAYGVLGCYKTQRHKHFVQ